MKTIHELKTELETLIQEKINHLEYLGKEIQGLQQKIDIIQHDMKDVVDELQPVEFLIREQNPAIIELFDALKEIK